MELQLAYGQRVETDEPSWVHIVDGEIALMRGPREEAVARPGDILLVGGMSSLGLRPLFGLKATDSAVVEVWTDAEYSAMVPAEAILVERAAVLTMHRLLLEADQRAAALKPAAPLVMKQKGFAGKLAGALGMGGGPDVANALQSSSAFEGASDHAMAAVRKMGRSAHFGVNQAIVAEGDAATDVVLIASGTAEVARSGQNANTAHHLRMVGAGTMLGVVELLGRVSHPTSVIARDNVDAVILKGKRLLAAFENHDDVGQAVRIALLRSASSELHEAQTVIDTAKMDMAEENERKRSTPPPAPRRMGPDEVESLEEARKQGKRFI